MSDEHDAIPSKWVTDYHANKPQPDNHPMEFMDEVNRKRLRKHAEQHRDEPWFYGSAVLILLDTLTAVQADADEANRLAALLKPLGVVIQRSTIDGSLSLAIEPDDAAPWVLDAYARAERKNRDV